MAHDILIEYPEHAHSRRCDSCQGWFLAYSAKAMFCSGRCRATAIRKRQREGTLPPTEKRCSNCRNIKPLSEFYDRPDHPNGKKPVCIECYNKDIVRNRDPEVVRAWNEKNRLTLRKQAKANYRLRRATLRGWLMTNLTTRRQQCRQAGIEFTLTVDEVLELYERQNGLCARTGFELVWGVDSNRGMDVLSIDRIDAVGPYAIGNIRLVTHWVNVSRQRMTDEEHLTRCRALVAYSGESR